VVKQQAIMYRGVPCYSFRQLDEQMRAVKGTAFRAFKRVRDDLLQDVDYFYLDADEERDFIELLRARGLIYRSSWHLVLLTDAGRSKVL
jgi:hypothetical protein